MGHASSRSRSLVACVLFILVSMTVAAAPPVSASPSRVQMTALSDVAIGDPVAPGLACWARLGCRRSYNAYLTARSALVGVDGSYRAQVAAFTLLSATRYWNLSVSWAHRLATPGLCAVRSARLVGLLDDVQRRGSAADSATVMLKVAMKVRGPVPTKVVYLPADLVLPLAVAVAWKSYWSQQAKYWRGLLVLNPC